MTKKVLLAKLSDFPMKFKCMLVPYPNDFSCCLEEIFDLTPLLQRKGVSVLAHKYLKET